MPCPPPRPAARVLAAQVLVGITVAALAVLVEGTGAAIRGFRDPGIDAALRALVHLAGLFLPLGLGVGLGVGVVLVVLDRTPWLAPLRARWGRPGAWTAPDPVATAGLAGLALAVPGFVAAVWVTGVDFANRFHRPELAFLAFGVLAVGLVAAAVVVASLGTVALLPVLRRFPKLARPVVVPVTAVVLGGGLLGGFLARYPRWLRVLDVGLFLAPALAAVAYLVMAVVLAARRRRRLKRHGAAGTGATTQGRRWPLPRSLVGMAVALGLLAVALGVASAVTYGGSSRVRTAVERRTFLGLPLLRRVSAAFDRDGDGHAPVFGGGDCNDGDASVYPGAPDPAGDGVDGDCFAGDGTPSLTLLSDGELRGRPAAAMPGVAKPNVLLVTIDALRPDHLGAWGYDRETSPYLDRFAAKSTRFANAVATSSRSIRSIPSMMTGRYPSQIAYGPEYLFPSLAEDNVTLAEMLRDAGWQTAVVMGTDYFVRSRHFFQGFDDVDQSSEYRPRRRDPVDRAIRRLKAFVRSSEDGGDDGAPFFLWVHLFNVHEPYLWDRRQSRFGDEPIDQYDTEIFLADRELRRLLDALARSPAADRTVTIVASDHGEAFGEHGTHGHSYTLYEEELRAPLLVHVPGLPGAVVEETVGLHDLTPTVLDLAGVPTREPVAGISLVPWLGGDGGRASGAPRRAEGLGGAPRLFFAELMPDGLLPFDRRVVREGDLKLHWWLRDGTYELYDLATDPGETRDLSDARPRDRERLLTLLRRYVAANALPEHRRTRVVRDNRLRQPPERVDHRLDLRYPGRFTVIGYDLPKRAFRKGERIPITFYYAVTGLMDESLFFEVSFRPPPGHRLPPHFHGGHYPLDGRYLTREWRPGEFLRDPLSIIIPETLETPVRLTLQLAVYHRGEIVRPAEGDGRTALVDVRID